MSLDSNERTQYKAREMKSVFLQAQGSFLKMKLYQCFTNNYNLFNQVGIVALNFVGKAIPGASRQQNYRPLVDRVRRGGGPVVPSPEPSSFDRETAQKLRELREMKLVAIEREDYDEAKRIKMEEQVLKELGKFFFIFEFDIDHAFSHSNTSFSHSNKTLIQVRNSPASKPRNEELWKWKITTLQRL